ncbi:MAG: ribbon-helix-helix domain-containing protein [Acidobacteriota bacterium]|mgnify:CR=1 FL=1
MKRKVSVRISHGADDFEAGVLVEEVVCSSESQSICFYSQRAGNEVLQKKTLTTRYDRWYYSAMNVAKVTISIESALLTKVDRLVKERVFSNRSQAVQAAVEEKLSRMDKNRLARECAKLDRAEERSLADKGLASEADEWPEY